MAGSKASARRSSAICFVVAPGRQKYVWPWRCETIGTLNRIESERFRNQFVAARQIALWVDAGAAIETGNQNLMESKKVQGSDIVGIDGERLFAERVCRRPLPCRDIPAFCYPPRRIGEPNPRRQDSPRASFSAGRLRPRGVEFPQGARQMGDDLVLRRQQIGAGGVELLGPQMRAASGVDQLGIDPDLARHRAAPSPPEHSGRPDPCRSPWRRSVCPCR